MKTDSKKTTNANSTSMNGGNKIIYLLIAIAIVYFVGRMFVTGSGKIETTQAMLVTVDDSVTATGYFIRDEQIIPEAKAQTVEYSVVDGVKVRKGAELAVEYIDAEALETSKEIDVLQQRLSLLKTAKQSSGDSADSAKLNQLIIMNMGDVNEIVRSGEVSGLEESTKELRELALKKSITTANTDTLDAEIETITQQINGLKEKLKNKTRKISSPYSGYFSEVVDGYEEVLKASTINELTPEYLDSLDDAVLGSIDGNMGKIIDGFVWYFAANIDSTYAEEFKKGDKLHLRFSQVSKDVPAQVYSMQTSGDKTLIIFESRYVTEELVSMRKQTVDIIKNTYTGIKIPKPAVRMIEDKLGIYILNGSVSKFKEIDPIYEDDNFYLSKLDKNQDSGIVLGDDIIVKAKDIEDKKVVK